MDRNIYGGVLFARVSALKHKVGTNGMNEVLDEMKKLGYNGPINLADIKPKQRYPIEYIQQMNNAIVNIYDEEKLMQIAKESAKKKGIVGVFIKWAATLEMIMKKAPGYWKEFYDFGTMETVYEDHTHKMILHDAFIDELSCTYLTSYYSGVLQNVNVKGDIIHTKCVGRGDDYCEWSINTGKQVKEQKVRTKEEIEKAGIYGTYRPEEIRDAISHCLIDVIGDKETANLILKEQFQQAGASWDEPTKHDLTKIITLLAQEARIHRDNHTIESNFNKIQRMIGKCECKDGQQNMLYREQKNKRTEYIETKDQTTEDPEIKTPITEEESKTSEKKEANCPYADKCKMFSQYDPSNPEITIAKMWCTTKDLYPKCIRKQLKDAGKEVPKNLLPTGKYIE